MSSPSPNVIDMFANSSCSSSPPPPNPKAPETWCAGAKGASAPGEQGQRQNDRVSAAAAETRVGEVAAQRGRGHAAGLGLGDRVCGRDRTRHVAPARVVGHRRCVQCAVLATHDALIIIAGNPTRQTTNGAFSEPTLRVPPCSPSNPPNASSPPPSSPNPYPDPSETDMAAAGHGAGRPTLGESWFASTCIV